MCFRASPQKFEKSRTNQPDADCAAFFVQHRGRVYFKDFMDSRLHRLVKAAGGKWMAEEKFWYVRYGTIKGGPLEKYIHVDDKKNRLKNEKYLYGDEN
jgi:hypothetical protein